MKTIKTSLTLCILTLAAILFATGCASDSQKSEKSAQQAKEKRPSEERLHVGMTKEEVRKELGDPAGKSMNSSGSESWNYNDNAKAWIPFYAVGGGKFQHLVVNFDTDGKVKDWSAGKQGMY